MKKATISVFRLVQASSLAVLLTIGLQAPAFAQISFDDEASYKADSRKVRREAAKYKADDVKESHLDMDKYSYKRGAFGNRKVNYQMATD